MTVMVLAMVSLSSLAVKAKLGKENILVLFYYINHKRESGVIQSSSR